MRPETVSERAWNLALAYLRNHPNADLRQFDNDPGTLRVRQAWANFDGPDIFSLAEFQVAVEAVRNPPTVPYDFTQDDGLG